MSNPAKDLRKQIRNEVKDTVKELLASEFINEQMKLIREEMNSRLDVIDERQKDIQGYIIRQSGLSVKTNV